MPLPGRAADEDMPSIPMTGPIESTCRINGHLYVFRTWTAAQWDRIPPDQRPKVSWPHGAGRATIEPS